MQVAKLPDWLAKLKKMNVGLTAKCEFEFLVDEDDNPLNEKKFFKRLFICPGNGVKICNASEVNVIQIDAGFVWNEDGQLVEDEENSGDSMMLFLSVTKTGERSFVEQLCGFKLSQCC